MNTDHSRQTEDLVKLLRSMPRVEAPSDFEFKLGLKLNEEVPAPRGMWPSFRLLTPYAALSLALLLAGGVASLTLTNKPASTAVPNISRAATSHNISASSGIKDEVLPATGHHQSGSLNKRSENTDNFGNKTRVYNSASDRIYETAAGSTVIGADGTTTNDNTLAIAGAI